MLSFAGDAVVALLLIATIGYSIVLNRRLGSVRNDREKFEVLVRNLNAASQRAEAAVTNLRVTADDLSRRLEKKVEQARSLSDDLTYMIERGDGVADKLANQIRAGRDALKPDLEPEPKPAAKAQPRAEHVVEPVAPAVSAAARVEAALRHAPAEPAQRQSQSPAVPRPAFVRQEPIRVEPRVAVAAASVAPAAEPVAERANAPSRAERDLLRALAARRR
jgi:ABC-type transporter Mla subunit MlaD